MAFIYKLEYAVAMGLLDQNPTARIRNTGGAAIPLVLVGTGLRPEELFALERRDLDLEAGVLNSERVTRRAG